MHAYPIHSPQQLTGAIQLASVLPESIAWLWPGRIPLGRLTLLVGDPGLGKSLLTLDVAARLTTAAPWPDDARGLASPNPQSENPNPQSSSPASVLLLSAEDNLSDTVLPRLLAAGADPARVVAIPSQVSRYADDPGSSLVIRRDLQNIRRLLEEMSDCRLLVVDPVSAYLTGEASSNGAVRLLLAPLAQLAHDLNIAVVAVSHLRKRQGPAIYSTLGSLTFVSAARAAWLVARDNANLDRRLLLPIKNNLASTTAHGLAFQIESRATAPILRWHSDPVTIDADAALRGIPGRPRSERDDAVSWLQERLANGPLQARKIQEEAEAHGIRLITLRRAFRELNGQAVRVGQGELIGWFWRLPGSKTNSSSENSSEVD
jgi:hypothetical protein